MPPPIDATIRAAILDAIRAVAEGESCDSATTIARTHDVARSTVTKIAGDEGLADAFDRTHTERASAARAADNKARRLALSVQLLDDVAELRERFFGPYLYVGSSKDGVDQVELNEPPADAVRNYVTAAAVLIDKHVALTKVDVESDQYAAVDAWLQALTGGMPGRAADTADD